jgi:antitoxin component YwqK of YwqJK toxin-antitoxin module
VLTIISFLGCKSDIKKEIASTYPNGTPIKIIYYKWKGDKKDIIKEIRFFPNGEKEIEGEYLNDKRHGKWTYWFDNGNKWSEGVFEKGVSNGKFTIWYKSGKKQYEASYKNGKPSGLWIFWDEDGKKTKEVYFEKGEKINVTDF